MRWESLSLGLFGLDKQHLLISSIPMPRNTGETCLIFSMRKLNLMECGSTWMNYPISAMGHAKFLKLRPSLIMLTISLIIQEAVRFKMEPSLWMLLITMATRRQMSTYSMPTFKPKLPTPSSPAKTFDHLLFPEVQRSAQQNTVIIGLETMQQLGSSSKAQSPTSSTATSTDLEWSVRISAVLLEIPLRNCVQDGTSWELFIPFLEAITHMALSLNNLMLWEK